jgi:hypothetical protein
MAGLDGLWSGALEDENVGFRSVLKVSGGGNDCDEQKNGLDKISESAAASPR